MASFVASANPISKAGKRRLRPPRKARVAWRASRIAWLVLRKEGRIVGRGAWHGGRLAARLDLMRRRVGLRRRRGQLRDHRLNDHRLKLAGGAIAGVVVVRLLRRRRGRGEQHLEPVDPEDDQLSLTLDEREGGAFGSARSAAHSEHNGNGAGSGATAAL